MEFLDRLSRHREKQIVSRARPYLNNNEDVVAWVRAQHPKGRPHGFVFLTEQRCIVHLPMRGHDGQGSYKWEELDSWGLDPSPEGGPVLCLEQPDKSVQVQIRVETEAMAGRVRDFMASFARLAPTPERPPKAGEQYRALTEVMVRSEKLSMARQTQRILVTILGVLLVLTGLFFSLPLVPGPGILVSIAGLAVLASEYDLAKDYLSWARDKYKNARERLTQSRSPS